MTKQEIIDYMYENHVQGDFKIEEMAEDLANTHGEWQDLGGIIRWGCPKCHHAFYEKTNFCPYCGDDKRGDSDAVN